MHEAALNREKLVDIWEDKRDIKNLMGRFTMALLHKREESLFQDYWSDTSDVCYGTNNGWYYGPEDVKAYQTGCVALMNKSDEIIRKRFPTVVKDMEEKYGHGYLEVKSLSSDVVVVADDGKTAKGMWACAGQETDMTEIGPITYWTYGMYAVDFIRENDAWKIWHMSYFEHIKHPIGEKWWEPEKERRAYTEFSEMADVKVPEPNIPCTLHEHYSTEREMARFQSLPVPYNAFSETFSYGVCKEEMGK